MNIIKNINHILATAICTIAAMAIPSCSDVELPSAPQMPKISNLNYSVEGRSVTLTWTLPERDDIAGVQVIANNTDLTELEGAQTSYFIKRATADEEIAYTVKAVYANGLVSEGETIRFTVEAVPAKIGYLISYNDVSEITDDDEQASAAWFQANISNGEILTPDDMQGVTPDDYSVIWIHLDRTAIGLGWENLPAPLISTEVISALTQYVKDGGNLFLANHATQLLVPIGRITEELRPGLFGDGTGSEGTDIWTINAIIGPGQPTTYDHRTHEVYAGLEVSNQYDTHESYPFIGPGIREDHNCMWDCNSYGFDGNPNVIFSFETETTSSVLATWGHVVDYCCAGLVEFYPSGDYLGRIMAMGLAAYEWNQNSGENPYQGNIELFTKNCLNYLSK